MKALMLALLLPAIAAGQAPSIEPTPQKMVMAEEAPFVVAPSTPIVVADDATEAELTLIRDRFADWNLPIVRASEIKAGRPAIYVGERERNAAMDSRRVAKHITGLDRPGPEGYRLGVSEEMVVVAGGGPRGTYYGLQTLYALAGGGVEIPAVMIRDEPDVMVRGVYRREPVSLETLQRLARLKCNMILYETADFFRLTGAAADRWRRAFEEARRYGMEPVPVVDMFTGGRALLEDHPHWAEGLPIEEHVFLEGTIPARLSRGHVLEDGDETVTVTYRNDVYRPGMDFAVIPGETAYPYREGTGTPWEVVRLEESRIPSGAQVTVRYSYAPAMGPSVWPFADGLDAALRETYARIKETLAPRLVHLGLAPPDRIARDLRTPAAQRSKRGWYEEAVTLALTTARDALPEAGFLMWADAFAPSRTNAHPELAQVMRNVPRDVVLCLRPAPYETGRALKWAMNSGREFLAGVKGGRAEQYIAADRVAAMDSEGAGVFAMESDAANAILFEKSWSRKTPRLIWPQALNAFFDTDLWRPDYDAMLDPMVRRLNRHVWAGGDPSSEFTAFEQALSTAWDLFPRDSIRESMPYRLYRNLTDYVLLEGAYRADGGEGTLARMAAIVEDHGTYAPDWPPSRTERIVQSMKAKGEPVPSTLVFGRHVAARVEEPPRKRTPLRIPHTPTYRDQEQQIEATFDFIAPSPHAFRLEFNGAGLTSVSVETSRDGVRWEESRATESRDQAGGRAPLLLRPPVTARYVRLTAETEGPGAVLRDAFAVGLRDAPEVSAGRIPPNPELGQRFGEDLAAMAKPADTFVNAGGALAAMPTRVHLAHDGQTLYIVANAYETREDTMVYEGARDDAFAVDHEAFFAHLAMPEGALFRFGVTPGGAMADARDGDAAWAGSWEQTTRKTEWGWQAQLAIPFETLEASLGDRDRAEWRADFTRVRRNVTDEVSHWADSGPEFPGQPSGRLTLR